jgi:hypothetical protein
MSKNIVSKTAQGLKWNYLSVFLTSIFQFIHLAIMARLLNPADFGLLAMAEVVLRFSVYFSRMGVGRHPINVPGKLGIYQEVVILALSVFDVNKQLTLFYRTGFT